MTTANDPRANLFALTRHMMTTPSEPLPPAIRTWLLAGLAEYLDHPTTLDSALALRAPGRPSVAREHRLRRRNDALREGAARLNASVTEVQAAIRRHRRRAPGRPPATDLDAIVQTAIAHAPLPTSEKQLKRILSAS